MKRNKYIDPAILARAQAAFRKEVFKTYTPEQWDKMDYNAKHGFKIVNGKIVIL